MSSNRTIDAPPRAQARVTAAEWFAGGQRIPYDPQAARVLTEQEAATTPGTLRVFERAPAGTQDPDTTWLTMLPGFPDGSYGWAQVDRLLGDDLAPRLYVEPVGQGDSDKPRDYPYSSVERADLVQALWPPSPATSAARLPSTSAAATRTPKSTGRSRPPVSACRRPRSSPSPAAT
jgi:hypothetical protein